MLSHRTLDAYRVYLIFSGATSLAFSLIFTVNMVYQATTVNLSPLQLVLVGTVLEATVFIFEIPTGIVADVYSRRLSVIIGTALMGVGFIVEGALPHFAAILLAQVLWGLGYTFTSGALDAWLADEIGVEQAGKAYLRAAQVGQAVGLLGTGASAALASIYITLPIVLGGALLITLAVCLGLFMPEAGFKPAPAAGRSSWRQMSDTLRASVGLVRARPVLLTLLGISAIYGMASEGYDRLWTVHMLEDFTLPALDQLAPVVWFGVIQAVGMLFSIGATEIARRRLDLNNHELVARALSGIYAALVVSVVVFALAGNFALALAAFWISGVLRATGGPVFTAWLNQHIESSVRATVISASQQANALGQIAGGPVVGAIGDLVSVRAAITAAGLALAPSLALFVHTLRGGQAVSAKEAKETVTA
ncbi:MAG: MFS transporter [Anaerolineae bacterium]|nr:MFS transporter [Anaerolineae bacterium]